MNPIEITPPLTCGACGGLVDESQAWHRWPHHTPAAPGEYIVLLQAPDTRVYQEFALWEGPETGWQLAGDIMALEDPWPMAWRHVPAPPEWVR